MKTEKEIEQELENTTNPYSIMNTEDSLWEIKTKIKTLLWVLE
jgi:hypothetical protein